MSERALKKSAIGRGRNAVDSRVYARRLGDESAIDAKRGSAALFTGVLFEHVDGYSTSSEADSRRESGERSPYDCDVTRERFRHVTIPLEVLKKQLSEQHDVQEDDEHRRGNRYQGGSAARREISHHRFSRG